MSINSRRSPPARARTHRRTHNTREYTWNTRVIWCCGKRYPFLFLFFPFIRHSSSRHMTDSTVARQAASASIRSPHFMVYSRPHAQALRTASDSRLGLTTSALHPRIGTNAHATNREGKHACTWTILANSWLNPRVPASSVLRPLRLLPLGPAARVCERGAYPSKYSRQGPALVLH